MFILATERKTKAAAGQHPGHSAAAGHHPGNQAAAGHPNAAADNLSSCFEQYILPGYDPITSPKSRTSPDKQTNSGRCDGGGGSQARQAKRVSFVGQEEENKDGAKNYSKLFSPKLCTASKMNPGW